MLKKEYSTVKIEKRSDHVFLVNEKEITLISLELNEPPNLTERELTALRKFLLLNGHKKVRSSIIPV